MRRNVKKTEGKGRVKKKLEKKMTKLNERNRKKAERENKRNFKIDGWIVNKGKSEKEER